jgi:hypothetical protein
MVTRALRFARWHAALGRGFVRCLAPSAATFERSGGRRNRRGGVKLGCFAVMVLLGLGGWAGAYVGDAYWKYYQFADAFKQEAKFAGHYTDRQIKQHLRSMADSLVLPDDAYEIVVERGRHHIVIDNQYYAHVNMGFMSRDFFFNPHAEADF